MRQNHTQSHPTSENTSKKLCLSRRTFMILVICISTYISGFLYHESAIHATLPTVSLVCHLVPWHRSLARPTAGASAAPGGVPSSCTGVAAGPPVTSKRKTIKRKGSPAVSRKINHLHITICISEIQFIYLFQFHIAFHPVINYNSYIVIVRYIIKLKTWKISGSSRRPLNGCNLKSKIVICI